MPLPTVLLALALGAPASADEPASFTLDPVFVSRFQPSDDAEKDAAEHVRELLEQSLSTQFLVVERKDVPAFEDYSAETYLQSCPPENVVGCAFVIAGRAEAQWSIAGTVGPGEEDGSHAVGVSFIDVDDSRVVFSFTVDVSPDEEPAFAKGVADVLDKIVHGAGAESDVRGDVMTPQQKADLAKQQAKLAQQELADLQGELGEITAEVPTERISAPKISVEDLQKQYSDRDDVAPWQRLGMSQAMYVRFHNSGKNLEQWRALMRGREGEVVVSAYVGGGTGPFGEEFDERRGLDRTTLATVEVDQYQEAQQSSGLLAGTDVGFGVLPWLEVGFGAGYRATQFAYTLGQQVDGQKAQLTPGTALLSSFQFGPRATFAPLPTRPYRPTVMAGVDFWHGGTIGSVVDASELPAGVQVLSAPRVVSLLVAPGAELDLGKTLTACGRLDLDLPIAGSHVETYQDGSAILTERGTPNGPFGPGVQVVGAIKVRLGPLYAARRVSGGLDEDEPE